MNRWFSFVFYLLLSALFFFLSMDKVWEIFQMLFQKLIFVLSVFCPVFAFWALFELPRKSKDSQPGPPEQPSHD